MTHPKLFEFENFFAGKKILVTGSSGLIGSSVLKDLSQINCHILGQYHTNQPAVVQACASLSLIESKIDDPKLWETYLPDVDIIIHLAAQTSAHKSQEDFIRDNQINVIPVLHALNAAKDLKSPPTIIFAGSATQIGLTTEVSNFLNQPDKPLTAYDINKLSVENYIRIYANQFGGTACTLRLANVFGPGGNNKHTDRGIVNQMVKSALNGLPLTIYGDGLYIRDYIFIDDVSKAFLYAAKFAKELNGEAYTIGTGQATTIKTIAQIIAEQVKDIAGQEIQIKCIPWPNTALAIEKRNFIADSSEFKKITGWNPRISINTGIRELIHFHLSR